MEWIRENRLTSAVVGTTLLVPLLVVLYVILTFIGMGRGFQRDADRLLPRSERLLGLVQSEARLADAVSEAKEQLAELAHDNAVEAASIQQDILELMNSAGMSVSNSRILPSKQDGGFEQLELRLTISGGMPELDRALTRLEQSRPAVLVSSLTIEPNRIVPSRPELSRQTVRVNLTLLSLRAIK